MTEFPWTNQRRMQAGSRGHGRQSCPGCPIRSPHAMAPGIELRSKQRSACSRPGALTALGLGRALLVLIGASAVSGAWAQPASPSPPAAGMMAPATGLPPPASAPLTIERAVAIGLQVNPALRGAQERTAAAAARVLQARAQRRFQVTWSPTVSGSSGDVLQPPPKHEAFGTVENAIDVPLPFGRRLPALQRQAEEEQASTAAAAQSARLNVVQQVQGGFFDVLRQQALRGIAEQNLKQAQRQLSDARIRFTAGDVAQLDVLRAQVPVATAQAALLRAQNTEAVARRTLDTLLQYPPDATPALAEPPLPADSGLTLAQAEAQAQAQQPDIQIAEADVRAAQAALEVARRSLEPQFAVQAIDARSNDVTGFSRLDTLLLTASVPLSDGGLTAAQVRERRAILSAQQRALEATRQTVRLAVDSAFLNAQSARQQIPAAQDAATIAATSYNRTREAYAAGRDSIRDVLDAQAALTQTQIALAQVRYDAAEALAALNRAIGKDGG